MAKRIIGKERGRRVGVKYRPERAGDVDGSGAYRSRIEGILKELKDRGGDEEEA